MNKYIILRQSDTKNDQIFTAITIINERTIELTFRDKIEILLRRKGYKKTEFADKLGITYRALANYMSGARRPRAAILRKIQEELEVTADFLFDEKQGLVLDSEERFLYNSSEESLDTDKAMELLKQAKALFQSDGLVLSDKQSLFSCLTEVYFDAINKNNAEQ